MKLHIKCIVIACCIGMIYSKPTLAQSGAQIIVHSNTLPDSLIVEAFLADKVFTAFGRDEDFEQMEMRTTKLHFTVNDGVLNLSIPNLRVARNVSFGYMVSPVERRTLNIVGLSDYMYLSPGDSVEIWENNGKISFKGKSAAKFRAFQLINPYRDSISVNQKPLMDSTLLSPKRIISIYQKVDYFTSLELKSVAGIPDLDPIDKEMLQARSVMVNEEIKRTFWTFHGGDRVGDINWVYDRYHDPFWSDEAIRGYAKSPIVAHTVFFLQRLRATYYYDSCYRKGKTLDIAGNYNFYSKYAAGDILEWLVYRLVKENLNSDGGTGSIKYSITDALAKGFVHNKKAKEDFDLWLRTNVAGVKAFNFEVIDSKGKIRHLSDYKGSVLLLDFWFIGCGNCIKIQPALDSTIAYLKEKKFLLLSICLDDRATKDEWLREIKRGIYTNDDHVNLFASTRAKNGQALKEKLGIDYAPLLILIDKEGNIAAKPTAPGWGLKPEFLLKTINRFL